MIEKEHVAAEGIERFRAAVLFILRRDIIELNEDKLPPIIAENAEDAITHNLPRDQQLLADIFCGSVEIWESQEALKDIEKYLSRNPYSKLGVAKNRYLKYHVTNYLNEVYILQKRLEAFTKLLRRKYRKNPSADLMVISAAGTRAANGFSTIVELRGVHVHERRFTSPELHRLAGLEIMLSEKQNTRQDQPDTLANIDASKKRYFVAKAAEHRFRHLRAFWKRAINDDNAVTEQILSEFFDALYPLLFDDRGEMRRPCHWPANP